MGSDQIALLFYHLKCDSFPTASKSNGKTQSKRVRNRKRRKRHKQAVSPRDNYLIYKTLGGAMLLIMFAGVTLPSPDQGIDEHTVSVLVRDPGPWAQTGWISPPVCHLALPEAGEGWTCHICKFSCTDADIYCSNCAWVCLNTEVHGRTGYLNPQGTGEHCADCGAGHPQWQ